jgi:hypothetical protein
MTLATPASSAWACGGLFCSPAQPVVQEGEDILFVVDGDDVEMHVRIRYAGPAEEFAWIVPVPPDVLEDFLSLGLEAAFSALDAAAPVDLQAMTVREGDCAASPEECPRYGGA